MDYDEVKRFFTEDNTGQPIFDHIAEVVRQILNDKPENPLSDFELYSSLIKASKAAEPETKEEISEVDKIIQSILNKSDGQDDPSLSGVMRAKYKPPEEGEEEQPPEEGEGEEPEELSDPGTIQDVVHELEALQWAGIGVGEEDGFRIYLSLIRLSQKNGGINLRFWGKIFGTKKDYYIAESETGEGGGDEEEEGNDDIEGDGPNKYTYFATNSVGGPWIKLPRVSALHIREARKIKRYFTGDLDEIVRGHPPFPGKEKEFLRAQIARISAGTILCPSGIYRLVDPEDPMTIEQVPEDEEVKLDIHTYLSHSGWVHINNELNTNGRIRPKLITNEDGEEITDPNAPPIIPLLTNLDNEKKCWTIRYNPQVGVGIPINMISLRCNRWPGAYTVGFGNKYTNIYIGYGVKNGKENYSPEPLAPLMDQCNLEEYGFQPDVFEDPNPPKVVDPNEEGQEEGKEEDVENE